MPSSTRLSSGKVMRTENVRDCWSALPATSRTVPSSRICSYDQKVTFTGWPGANWVISSSGTAICTSFSPSTATEATGVPAPTTWPVSALMAVTMPFWSDLSSA